ncbi:MAG TPA: zf-HC2 domain-containing protein [Gammaproteobacteria bacterium]|nr:zf-HC2 domain-containing protein [Gammaproteobacteria bacterium]
MLTCKQATELASKSLDKKLSFRQRIELRLHLLMCRQCRNYLAQLHILRRAARQMARSVEKGQQQLSSEARKRIRNNINELKNNSD